MTPLKDALRGLCVAAPLMMVVSGLTPVMQAQAQIASRVETQQTKKFISDLGAQAIYVLRSNNGSIEQREAIFREMLASRFSMPFIGRFVLRRYWQSAPPNQQEEYLALFSEFVLRNYAPMLGGYLGEQFEVMNAIEAGKKDTLITTRISGGAREPIGVDWRLRMIHERP